ncbi:MAG: hypothetical protein NXH97_15430 [Rhodobacteraceae bacterium]|nr:hypothetical protein [Paracoccaceae bacterium]
MSYMHLPTVMAAQAGAATNGVSVTSFGQGQVTGATYTVPAHGKIKVEFDLQLLAVTGSDIENLNNLIRGMLNASEQKRFDSLSKSEASGGSAGFLFFSGGYSHRSSSEVTQSMDSWGLTRADQDKIITQMLTLTNKTQKFKYKGTIFNKDYDYDVTGNLFGIVMDATIQQGTASAQVRMLAPDVHMQDSSTGATIPSVGKLY